MGKKNIVSNFTNAEIANLAKALKANTSLSMRINKCGNIDVEHSDSDEVHFVFYHREDGYFIRRRLGTYRGINQHGGIMNGGKHFATMKETIDYFTNYMEKHTENLYTSYSLYAPYRKPRISRYSSTAFLLGKDEW